MSKPKPSFWRGALWALAVCALVGVLAISAFIAYWARSPFGTAEFDRERWHAAWDCADLGAAACEMQRATCTRGGMLDDLIALHLTPTQSRDSVQSLLGDVHFTTERPGLGTCEHRLVGMCSGFRIDYDSLYICYNTQGFVTASGHVQH